tara:strand:+ start:342 stop:539 length:198 start_codon:yes stop_codon:yes gene_type:complete
MKNSMKYITVLDFEDGKVYQYEISAWGNGDWNPDSESCEEYLASIGHNLANIEWMVHSDNKIITK